MEAVIEHGLGRRLATKTRAAALYVLTSAALLDFAGALGPRGLALDHGVGLVVCAAIMGLGWSAAHASVRSKSMRIGAGALLAVGWIVATLAIDRTAWLFAVTTMLTGLALRADGLGSRFGSCLRSLALMSWLFATWSLAKSSTAFAWQAEQRIAGTLAHVMGATLGVEFGVGGTVAGLGIALLHSVAICVCLRDRATPSRSTFALAAFGLSIPWFLQVSHVLVLCVLLRHPGSVSKLAHFAGSDLLLIRAGLDWAALFLFVRTLEYAPRSEGLRTPSKPWLDWVARGCASMAILALLAHELGWSRAIANAQPGRIFVVANPDRGGLISSHAGLWRRAIAYGFSVEPYVDLAEETAVDGGPALEHGSVSSGVGRDIFVVPFPTPSWLPQAAPRILRAVDDGAGLLVLSDHTNAAGTADLLAPILAPAGFAIAFDAIDPMTERWFDSMELARHPLAPYWRRARSAHYGVGASIVVPPSGEVLASGRYALADRGNAGGIPGNYIGDRRFGQGDALGDCALVASARYGDGRIVVAGDPEFLLSDSLPDSAELARGLLAYLSASPPRWLGAEYARSLALALLGVASVLYCMRRDVTQWPAAALAVACWIGHASALYPTPYASHRERLVLADVGFRGAYYAHKNSPGLLDGLFETLERRQYCVEMGRLTSPALDSAAAAILIAPHGGLADHATDELLSFVRGGKTLLLSVGHQHAAAVSSLLDAAGIQVLPRIVGRAFDSSSDPFADSNPLMFREAYALALSPEKGAQSLYTTPSGETVVAEAGVGSGRIVVIGDPSFLLGGNLSSDGRSFPQNQSMLVRAISGP